MNIVTIMNYPDEKNCNTLCMMWMHFIQKFCTTHDRIYILSNEHLNQYLTNQFSKYSNVSNMIMDDWKPETIISPYQNSHNIKFKLFNLCNLGFEYIFIDADAIVLNDINYLWNKRNDKPFIAINHQTPPDCDEWKFLNSGVLIVSDPKFLDFDKIINIMNKKKYIFEIGGCDQPCFWEYFKSKKYDYTHPDIGPEWNSCADFNIVTRDENINWKCRTKVFEPNYDVNIHHYWNTKPWNMNCPIFSFYKDLVNQ